MKKVKTIFAIFLAILILISIHIINEVQARYAVSKTVKISYKTTDYYFDVTVDKNRISSFPATINVTVKNNDGTHYANTDITYTIGIDNENYTVTAVDGNTKTLIGGSSKQQTYAVTIDKTGTDDSNKINLTFTVNTPYNDIKNVELTISLIPDYYGAEITNYDCEAKGVDKWRVFHKDENGRIYLVADDYIPYSSVPLTTSGIELTKGNTDYKAYWNTTALNNYIGSEWILNNTNGNARKWLDKFLTAYPSSTYNNIKATAYMMDTESWSSFVGDNAEYAIGGPTLELFCDSYKITHPDRYIECNSVTASGYQIKWSDATSYAYNVSGLTKDDFNGIYIKSDTTKTNGMWLASPSAYSSNYEMNADYSGNASYSGYNSGNYGFRPIVCLKTGTKLVSNEDGTYRIDEPIDAKAIYDKTEEKIKIEVTYTKNGIAKILDEDGNILSQNSLTADTGDKLLENLRYTFTVIDNAGNEKKVKITVSEVLPDYYGAIVTNYDCEEKGVDKWRVFHKDIDGKIYLIADDYVPYSRLPRTTAETTLIKGNTDYKAYWNGTALNNYTGSEWILNNTNENARKILNKFLALYPSSTNYNIKAVAYMMDTESWSSFVGDNAEYAIGGPTIELFCDSYKVTHPNRYIECNNVTANGYQIKWSDATSYAYNVSGLTKDDYNSIYIKSDTTKTNGMWLASPSANSSNYEMNADYSGNASYNGYNSGNYGFRPIVCLKAGTKLVSNEDGTYRIDEPIDAKAIYDETEGKIKIEVTYTKNEIEKILDEDGNILSQNSLTADTGDKVLVNTRYTFTIIDNKGNVKTIKISDIIPKCYGALVTNYDCEATGVDKWRVFHNDADGKIYLIADDYVPYSRLPRTTAGTALIKGNTDYKAYWNGTALNNYTGSGWILNNTNENARKWLNKYLTAYPNSTYNNIKATAYMMDTESWSGFVGDNAEYAMGGPTLELFCDSYKVTHPDRYIECNIVNTYGYFVKWNGVASNANNVSGLAKDEFNSIYIKSDTTKTNGMWIASPSSYSNSTTDGTSVGLYMMFADYNGNNSYSGTGTNSYGFRPIVCLKTGTKLISNEDGTYRIDEPIDAKAIYDETEEKIKIEVTYTKNGIAKILDEDGNILSQNSLTADTGDKVLVNTRYTFTIIDNKGNVKTVKISDIIPKCYGALVTNYDCEATGVDKWRVFHNDADGKIYLIADDYIPYSSVPLTTAGIELTKGNTDYKAYWNTTALNNYIGSEWILNNTNENARKWLDKFLTAYPSSTYNNIKATAYMMDTESWSSFVGDNAEYAIGGPTLELFCDSYKVTHPYRYIECDSVTASGYQIKWSDATSYAYNVSGLAKDDFNGIYIKSDKTKTNGMWLASPSANSSNYEMNADYSGNASYSGYNSGNYGFRPIVCLKAGTKLVSNEDGTYRIDEPIDAKAIYDETEEKIKIEVTYTKNGIAKILDEDGNILSQNSLTADTGDKVLENLRYTYTIIDNVGNEKKIKITVSKVLPEYYGAEVINYDCEATGVDKWRVFHKDIDGKIYLIADDYIPYSSVPLTKAGLELTKGNTNYKVYWNTTALNNYTGSEWILNNTNENARKLLNKYLALYPSSTNYNIKAVAYMMDTESWSGFAGDNAEYAIGGPTIELFCDSYKVTHPNRYIECNNVTANGYQIKWSDATSYAYNVSGLAKDEFNSIYIKSDTTKTNGMWIASPSAASGDYEMYVDYNGNASGSGYTSGNYGFRPIVCLKTGTKLISNEDGTYRIDEPIDAKAIYDETEGKIKIEVTYTKNGIAKILDEDGNILSQNSLTADTGDKVLVNTRYTFTIIDNKGNVKIVKISDIIPKCYGALVTNYDCEATGVDKWRVFHNDADGKIYLIADDYIPYSSVPKTTAGTALIKGNTDYKVYWNGTALNNYTGSEWILNNTNENARKWLNKYLTAYPNSTYNNIKATAYMMDTESWSGFAGDNAEYAMGGPTLELFCDSYKATHPTQYIKCNNITAWGYQVKFSNSTSYANSINGLTIDDCNSIYIKSNTTRAQGMWIASTSASDSSYIWNAIYGGSLNSNTYGSGNFGFRPIVCLKAGTKLISNEDGTYRIDTPIDAKATYDETSGKIKIEVTYSENGIAKIVDEYGNILSQNSLTADTGAKVLVNTRYTFTIIDNEGNTKTVKISNVIPKCYGAVVTNYECEATGVNKWRVFYNDADGRIYLIADDYVSYDNLPTTTAGTALTKGNTNYKVYWNTTALNNYTGSEWILNNTNENARKLLNTYLTAYPNSTYNNIKATAYMMDTESWSGFVGDNAEYAMGGPTIEMFCDSYKVTHPYRYIECDSVNATGYYVKWSDTTSYANNISGLTQDDFNKIYTNSDSSKASGMWITSPNCYNSNTLIYGGYNGAITYNSYSSNAYGFRPIVCLKTGTKLVSNGDGTYSIQ